MIKYLMKDLAAVLRYLPYSLLAGAAAALVFSVINKKREGKQQKQLPLAGITGLFMYSMLMLCITFWSREAGGSSVIDMKLFSTLGINNRNDAFMVENILLFIPYGFLCAWVIPCVRKPWRGLSLGLATSMGIEILQLVTGRGYFQIDDILTNTLGAVLGVLLYRILQRK